MKPYKIFGKNIEHSALEQFYSALKQDFVVRGALMPDAHTDYSLPIGAVVATDGVILPVVGKGRYFFRKLLNRLIGLLMSWRRMKRGRLWNVMEILNYFYYDAEIVIGRDGVMFSVRGN